MTIIKDYFAVEPILVEKIKTDMPEILAINTPFTIEAMLEASNESPSINIIYFDDRIGESASNGKTANIYQQWLVVLCVRNAEAQLQQTNEIRKDADPLIRKVLDTLQGFDPKVEGYRMFKRANSPVRIGNSPGFAFFPLMFEIQAYT
ncbi:phage tail terminator protein [Acinetobacter junii]|uniref:phage tail terminator protein n=1 Tax=Acinetobacter junii TaxID=40215 RepID=UPI00301830C0